MICIESLVEINILLHRNMGISQQIKAISSHINLFRRQLLILVTGPISVMPCSDSWKR